MRSPIVFDEAHLLLGARTRQPADSRRERMRRTFVTGRLGWCIGERFDGRYDTEVGGTVLMSPPAGATEILSFNLSGPLTEWSNQLAPRPSLIIDYLDGEAEITPEDAAGKPELAEVLVQLRAREAEYAALGQTRPDTAAR